jgi:ribosomal protein L11 methyltransferase
MPWARSAEVDFVVRLVVPSSDAEVATDRLWAEGATAVEERSTTGEEVVLEAGFPTPAAAATVARSMDGELVEVDEATWRDVWRGFAQPVRVGTLVVAPAWRRVEIGGTDVVVSIDPGGCFGSGSHATTRLMLGEIERRMPPGASVFDVGTGSGVLSIAAARLGASRVVAVDIDPGAVEITRANAAGNGVSDVLDVSADDAATVAGPFDLVVANLTAAVLAGMAGVLSGAVGPGGLLLLSGLLAGQWRHVAGRFAALQVLDVPTLEGWVGVVLRRP